MRKKSGIRRSFRNLFLQMLIGGIAGACFALAMYTPLSGWIQTGIQEAARQMKSLRIAGMAACGIALLSYDLFQYFRLERLTRRAGQTKDEDEAVRIEERLEFWHKVNLTLNSMACIFFLMLYGADPLGGGAMALLLVFLAGSLVCPVFYCLFVYQMKRLDPRISADPMSFGFEKKCLQACDEAERVSLYGAGFHANRAMCIVLLGAFMLAFLGNVFWRLGAFPVVLSGGLWLIQTALTGYYKIKTKSIRENVE